jgi:hypothetical protein
MDMRFTNEENAFRDADHHLERFIAVSRVA